VTVLQKKAKAVADILVANGVLPPPGMSVEKWKAMNPQPMSFEGAYLVILETLRSGDKFSDG
jgi:hypothetical protein